MRYLLMLTLAVLCLPSAPSFARSNYAAAGSATTMGPTSSPQSLFGASYNPAMASLMIKDREKWRMNFAPSLSVEAEVGSVDNFADELDELISIIDDPSTVDSDLDTTLDRFNGVLKQMGEEGYFRMSSGIHAPISPLYFKSTTLGGTFSFALSAEAQLGLRILDDELTASPDKSTVITNTSLYIKSGIEKKLSIGYSRLLDIDALGLPPSGRLHGGVRLSLIQLELSKQITWIDDLGIDKVEDSIDDQYNSNLKSTNGIAIDVGVVWTTEKYTLGFTLANLNNPSFDYGTIGTNCSQLTANTAQQNSCYLAQDVFIPEGRIKEKETHTKHALGTIDALYKVNDRWHISSAYDLASYNDTTGFDNQWFHLATSYTPKHTAIPAIRLGYKTNTSGFQVSSMMVGFTFFHTVNLDLLYGLEKTTADGTTVPRSAGFSLAFSESF